MKKKDERVQTINDNMSSFEFVEKTKRGEFTKEEANIPKEYIIRYDFSDNINMINETIEECHFGITN